MSSRTMTLPPLKPLKWPTEVAMPIQKKLEFDSSKLPASVDVYAIAQEGLSAATRAAYTSALQDMTTHLGLAPKDVPLWTFIGYLRELALQGFSESRILKVIAAMRIFQFSTAPASEQWISGNTFATARKGIMAATAKSVHYAALDYEKLTQLVKDLHNKYNYALGFALAYEVTLRHGELVSLRVGDVTTKAGKVFITVIGGKNREGPCRPTEIHAREIESRDIATRITKLAEGRRTDDPLFRDWDREVANRLIQQAARKYKWAGNSPFSFHSLRHGRAHDLALEGKSLEEIRSRGNWRSQHTAAMYAGLQAPPSGCQRPGTKRQRE